tara:strand:- start:435 stop:1868 length:1434 start_codon:yes stop_codon:yes gene_type:complete
MAQKIHTTTTGDVTGNTLGYTFDFPSLAQSDIRVSVAGVLKTLTTDYTIEQWSATGSTSNFIQFVNSTKRGTGNVRIFRETPKTNPKASFTSGSAIKADDLNNNQKQAIYIAEEFEDDMTNLAANDTSGFSINGSNIADNSITTTKIAGLNVEESDIANDAVTANKLKSSTSTDSVRAVTTNHIRDGAVTDAKIADGAVTDLKISGVDGSKVTPDFGSQNITTTGNLTISGKINTTSTGTNFTGNDFGFNTTPGGTPATKSVFLAIGDSDTGIAQDGDGQLEIWADNVEMANFNASNGITLNKPITSNSDIGTSAAIAATGNITANAPGKFIGDGSGLSGISSLVKQVKEATASAQQSTASSSYSDALTLTLSNTSSTSRVVVFSSFRIYSSTPYNGSRITYAKTTIGENGSFVGEVQNEVGNSSGTTSSSANYHMILLDHNSTSGNREYRIRFKKTGGTTGYIANCRLMAIEFEAS